MALFFSTAGAWGAGIGTLTPAEFDQNFWSIGEGLKGFNLALKATVVGIASLQEVSGSNDEFTVTLTNGHIDGPFTQAYLLLSAKGAWQPNTAYAVGDVVIDAVSLYEVMVPHTSRTTFSAGANNGQGLDYYKLRASFGGSLPAGGTTGEALAKLSDVNFDLGWSSATSLPAGGDISQALFKVTSPADGQWEALRSAPAPVSVLSPVSVNITALANGNPAPLNIFFNCTAAGGLTVHVDHDPHDLIPVNSEFHWRQDSGTAVIFTASGSPAPTLNGIQGFINRTAGIGSVVTLKKIAHETYDLFGRLA